MTTTPTAPALEAVEAARTLLADALALRPCHITGMHTPEHHLRFMCSDQKAAMLDAVLAALGLTVGDLPHRLHGESCGWCHRVPSQEEYRERLRQTYRWAGVEVAGELAEPAPDVSQPGDEEAVWDALGDELEPWQDVVPRVTAFTSVERYWRALRALGERVEIRDICARRRQPEPAPYEESEYGQGG